MVKLLGVHVGFESFVVVSKLVLMRKLQDSKVRTRPAEVLDELLVYAPRVVGDQALQDARVLADQFY
jgi:hypothetical protein